MTFTPSKAMPPSPSPSSSPYANPLKSLSRRLGFTKRSNLLFFLVLATTLTLFILRTARAYLSVYPFCNPFTEGSIPGECYYYTLPLSRYQLGIYAHLLSVIPGSLLAILQFIPSIRSRRPQVHRWVGYLTWFLGAVAIVSALMLWDSSFGGTPMVKVVIPLLGAITTWGHVEAYRGIKAGDIAKHRRWMLRTWAQFGSIVTMRPIMTGFAIGVTLARKYGVPGERWYAGIQMPCEALYYMLNEGLGAENGVKKVDFWSTYGAACAPSGVRTMVEPMTVINGTMSAAGAYGEIFGGKKVEVLADLFSPRAEYVAAALDVVAGPAILGAMLVHAIAVEWYLWSTREEEERLKKVGEAKSKAKARKEVKNMEASSVGKGDGMARKSNGHVKEKMQDDAKTSKKRDKELSSKALAGGAGDR